MIRLVPAERQDEPLILHWRNQPDAYAWAAQPRPVTPEEHAAWFRDHALDPTRCRLSLITLPVGWVRLDRMNGANQHGYAAAEVSLYVEPKHREHGYAGAALEQALDDIAATWARVRTDNPTAARFFERHGFAKVLTADGVMHYRRGR